MDIPPEEELEDPAAIWDAWQEQAMLVFKFDKEDLAANRQGRLSEKQRHRLMVNRNTATIVTVSVGMLFAILFLVPDSKSHAPLWCSASSFAMFAMMAATLFWIGSRSFRRGIVESATGMITFKGWPHVSAIEIGGERFPFLPNYERLFVPGVIYKVYFAPTDRQIMCAEIVPK